VKRDLRVAVNHQSGCPPPFGGATTAIGFATTENDLKIAVFRPVF
jgi:hypothetical protein